MVWLGRWIENNRNAVIAYYQTENHLLRQELGRYQKRPRLSTFAKAKLGRLAHRLGRHRLNAMDLWFAPDTLSRWHRELVTRKYTAKRSRTGRPAKESEIRSLALQMAGENPSWGYLRIAGALENLGYQVSKSTVRRMLRSAGLDPAPHRKKSLTWSTFLKRHWQGLCAADFITKEILTLQGLVRVQVLLVMEIATRRVH
jgi:hypothetical protein